MAKFSNDSNMDALLNRVKNNTVQIVLCRGQPVSYGEATLDWSTASTGKALGESTMSSTHFTGPVDGDVSGRKLTTNQVTGLNIDVTSTTADHVALITSSTASELLVVTTITTPQPVTSGNTATLNAWDYEVTDPT